MPHSKTSAPRSKLKRGNLGVPRGPATRLTLGPPLQSKAARRAATAPSSTRRRPATGPTSGTWSTWRSTDAPTPARFPAPRAPADHHLGPRLAAPPAPPARPGTSPTQPGPPGGCLRLGCWEARPSRVNDQDRSIPRQRPGHLFIFIPTSMPHSKLKRGNLGVPCGPATRLTLATPLKSKAARRSAPAALRSQIHPAPHLHLPLLRRVLAPKLRVAPPLWRPCRQP